MTRRDLLKGVLGAFGVMVLTPVEHVLGYVPFTSVHGSNGYIFWAFRSHGKPWPKSMYSYLPSIEEGWDPKTLDVLGVRSSG